MTAQSEGLNGGTSIRHFHTNNKKIFCNSKFYQEGNKNGSKQGNVILLSISRSFRPLSDDFRSFRKISEDVRKLLKFSKKKFRQMLLDGATLDCFERSRMTLLLCLSKLQNHPRFYRSSLELWQHRRRIHSMPPSASTVTKDRELLTRDWYPVFPRILLRMGGKTRPQLLPLWARAQSSLVIWAELKDYGFSTNTLQTLNSIFSGNSKH